MTIYPNIVSFFSRHMVALAWVDRRPEFGPWGRQCVASCVLIAVEGCPLLVTAGHVLADLETRLRQDSEALDEWGIVDGLGPESIHKHQIPFVGFHPANTHHTHADEKGLDFGIVRLDDKPLIWQALTANGKEPLSEDGWELGLPTEFDEYVLLGLPSQLQAEQSVSGDSRHHKATVLMIPVRKRANPPPALLPGSARFFGEIEIPFEFEGTHVTSIDGMSGGPIIGIKRSRSGKKHYWLLAIQSGWMAPDNDAESEWRPIAACYIKPFCDEVRSIIKRIRT